MDSSEFQLPSSTNTILNNSQLSESIDTLRTTHDMDIDSQSIKKKYMRESSSNLICNGIIGVPISFLDKYNPEQFEILGNENTLQIPKGRGYINGKRLYGRLFIRRKG